MREFKFRAWNKQENEMVDLVTVGSREVDKNRSTWPALYYRKSDGIITGFDHEDYEVLQYTGLKDKNGVEIYEGDIVQARYMSFYGTGWKAVIKFGKYDQDGSGDEYNPSKCFGFYVEAMNADEEDEDGFRKVEEYLIAVSPLEFEEIIVIGNIYENPELLGGESNGPTR